MPTLTNWRQGLGWAGLGVGGTSLIAAAVFSGLAVGTQNAALSSGHCPTFGECDKDGLVMRNRAVSLADGATATFIVGSVLAGTGLVLVLTAPKSNTEGIAPGKTAGLSLSTTISPMGFGFQGTW